MNDSEHFELDVAAEAPARSTTLEFAVTAAELPGFGRATAQQAAHLVWYDDADGTLTADRLCLSHDGVGWQLARLKPEAAFDWPACQPPSPLAAAADPGDLPVPTDLVPLSAFDGVRRRTRAGDVQLDWLHGTVHGVVAGRPAGRLTLTGPEAAIMAWLGTRAPLELSVPRASLAQEAFAAAAATPVPARHLGAPGLPADSSLSDGLATVLSHLLDVLLCWTDAIGVDDRPEAIHQARVATRRLRSALSIYRAVAPSLGSIAEDIRVCAARLGAVRDWDVFMTGTGAQLTTASNDDPRIGSLLRACRRKRDQAATALSDYLASPEFRRFELALGIAAALRPWESEAAGVGEATAPFAAAVLTGGSDAPVAGRARSTSCRSKSCTSYARTANGCVTPPSSLPHRFRAVRHACSCAAWAICRNSSAF